MRLFSSPSLSHFLPLQHFDNLTSFNIRQLLRNLLLFCSSWNRYSQLGLPLFSDGKQAASSDSVEVLFVFDLWMLQGRAPEVTVRWHWHQKLRCDLHGGLLSLPRELLCFTVLIWFKATYHSDTILTQSAKGHIGHTLIYFLFLSRLWLIRNDSNWAQLFDLLKHIALKEFITAVKKEAIKIQLLIKHLIWLNIRGRSCSTAVNTCFPHKVITGSQISQDGAKLL